VRGKDGPLLISKTDRSAIRSAVIEAGKQLGLEYDLQPGSGNSMGWCQPTRGGHRRASTARTYLHPALKRPNLQLTEGERERQESNSRAMGSSSGPRPRAR
jgi:choline dehydrogenase